MPKCNKCETKATKRKKDGVYWCQRHGFIRKIRSVVMLTPPAEKEIRCITTNT